MAKSDPFDNGFFCIFNHEKVLRSLQNHFKMDFQVKIDEIFKKIKRKKGTGSGEIDCQCPLLTLQLNRSIAPRDH